MSDQHVTPGYYPRNGELVWWNGADWDPANTRPATSGMVYNPPVENADGGVGALVICGYIFAVLIPLVGFILGIVAVNRPRSSPSHKHGWPIIGVSVLVFVVAIIIIVASANTASNYGTGY